MDAVETGMAKSEAAVCVNLIATRCRVASAPVSSGLSSVNNKKARTKVAMIRVTWKPYSIYKRPCKSKPL
jgi:hypothetical protein